MDIVSVPGRLVRDPVTRRAIGDLPVQVDPTEPYWARLLADGDVASAPAPKDAEPAAAAEPDHHEPAAAELSSQEHAA